MYGIIIYMKLLQMGIHKHIVRAMYISCFVRRYYIELYIYIYIYCNVKVRDVFREIFYASLVTHTHYYITCYDLGFVKIVVEVVFYQGALYLLAGFRR